MQLNNTNNNIKIKVTIIEEVFHSSIFFSGVGLTSFNSKLLSVVCGGARNLTVIIIGN